MADHRRGGVGRARSAEAPSRTLHARARPGNPPRAWRDLLAGLIPMLVTLAGCGGLTDQQRMRLQAGEQAFESKQYDAARQQLTQFLAEAQDRPEVGRALYVRGMASALSGHRAEAYADLQRATRVASDPALRWQPCLMLGVLYFEDENWTAAAQSLTEAAARAPNTPPKDAVWYRLGLCYERLGRWDEALTPYRRVVQDFARGPYAGNAERRLRLRASSFAVQCGVFSRADNANQLAARLASQGLKVYVQQEQRGEGVFYVVLEGRYPSYAQATAALARVRGHVPEAVLWP